MKSAAAALVLAALAAAPAAAGAAPFGELPFRALGERATCLRATGFPGELVRQNFERLEILDAQLAPVIALPADGVSSCAQAAARPSGTGVLAYTARDNDGRTAVRAYLRDPARGWTPAGVVVPPLPAGTPASEFVVFIGDPYEADLAAAASDRGDALVVVGTLTRAGARARVRVVRQAPGAAFAAPLTLFSRPSTGYGAPSVAAGMSAAGEAVVAWAAQPPRRTAPREVWAAIAPPGGAFAPPRKLGTLRVGAPFALAVGADGRALLAFATGGSLVVAERPPGGEFAAPLRVAQAGGTFGAIPGAAVRADGAAVVAWSRFGDESASAVARTGPGAFGAPFPLARPVALGAVFETSDRAVRLLLVGSGQELGATGARPDDDAGNPRVAFAPDGRALVTWAGVRDSTGVLTSSPHAAIVAPLAVQPLGAELRDADSVTPLVLADGRLAAAWTDNDPREESGRLHVAVEGAPEGADPSPPRVRVRLAGPRVLGPDDPVRLAVTCSAACDVRFQIPDALDAMEKVSLEAAGTREVELGSDLHPIAPLRTGPVKVLLRYGAPGARRASARTLSVRLRRRPGALIPDVRGLFARRSGDAVNVRFRTTRPVDPTTMLIVAVGKDGEPVSIGVATGAPRRGFNVRLDDATAARRAIVFLGGRMVTGLKQASVRVRG